MKLKLWMLLVFGIICLLCLRCLNWYFVLTMPGRRGARTWLWFLRIFWNKVSSASAIRCSSSKSVALYVLPFGVLNGDDDIVCTVDVKVQWKLYAVVFRKSIYKLAYISTRWPPLSDCLYVEMTSSRRCLPAGMNDPLCLRLQVVLFIFATLSLHYFPAVRSFTSVSLGTDEAKVSVRRGDSWRSITSWRRDHVLLFVFPRRLRRTVIRQLRKFHAARVLSSIFLYPATGRFVRAAAGDGDDCLRL